MNPSLFGQALLVGLGGFVGSAGRFLVGGLAHRLFPESTFPIGTLVVNVAGSLVIGLLGGLMATRQAVGPSQRLFLMIGVLGGFTTFSSFAYETLGLLQSSEFARAAFNIGGQIVLGLAAAWLGYVLARNL